MSAIQLQTSKWRRGTSPIKLYQRGGGKSNNQGPTGKRATRWYAGRALRHNLGKHGLAKLNKGKK